MRREREGRMEERKEEEVGRRERERERLGGRADRVGAVNHRPTNLLWPFWLGSWVFRGRESYACQSPVQFSPLRALTVQSILGMER